MKDKLSREIGKKTIDTAIIAASKWTLQYVVTIVLRGDIGEWRVVWWEPRSGDNVALFQSSAQPEVRSRRNKCVTMYYRTRYRSAFRPFARKVRMPVSQRKIHVQIWNKRHSPRYFASHAFVLVAYALVMTHVFVYTVTTRETRDISLHGDVGIRN